MEELDAEALALKAHKLFAQPCHFFTAATNIRNLPPNELPEVAFVGRSNVGKSTLLNALVGMKKLARASNTPGRTQQLNFFKLGDQLVLVDLPGYGYAKVSKSLSKEWNHLFRDYLRGRPQLRRVMLLIDSRHGLKPNDLEMMDFLDDLAVPYQIVMTKADKIPKKDEEPLLEATRLAIKKHAAALPEVLLTSAEDKSGIDHARQQLTFLTTF